jgi:hypothetical protein
MDGRCPAEPVLGVFLGDTVKKLLLIGTALLLTATSAQAEQMPPRARTMECAQEFVHRFYPHAGTPTYLKATSSQRKARQKLEQTQ